MKSISLVNLASSILYIPCSPFRLCRKFFERMKEPDIHMYGETPFPVWQRIIKAAALHSSDHFIDLGCGRGLLCFWSHCLVGCKSTGIDWVPTFIRRARLIRFHLRVRNIHFICGRLNQIDLSQATVLYLYTYHRDEEQIDFSPLPQGARVITVSEPLKEAGFFLKEQLEVDYPWGTTEVFISVKGVVP